MIAPAFFRYVSQEGDRWDALAWKYYGDATLYQPIIAANPAVPISAVFPKGTVIFIPVIAGTAVAPAPPPPWGF